MTRPRKGEVVHQVEGYGAFTACRMEVFRVVVADTLGEGQRWCGNCVRRNDRSERLAEALRSGRTVRAACRIAGVPRQKAYVHRDLGPMVREHAEEEHVEQSGPRTPQRKWDERRIQLPAEVVQKLDAVAERWKPRWGKSRGTRSAVARIVVERALRHHELPSPTPLSDSLRVRLDLGPMWERVRERLGEQATRDDVRRTVRAILVCGTLRL